MKNEDKEWNDLMHEMHVAHFKRDLKKFLVSATLVLLFLIVIIFAWVLIENGFGAFCNG